VSAGRLAQIPRLLRLTVPEIDTFRAIYNTVHLYCCVVPYRAACAARR
jgi:hypothetical protein